MDSTSAFEPLSAAAATRGGAQSSPLSAAGAMAAEHAMSSETRRAYERALRQITQQLAGRAMDDHGLSAAMSELVADGAGRAKLRQIVAAVRLNARRTGQPDPVGPSCEVVLATHRRSTPPARQAAAVDWEQADAAAAAAASAGHAIGLRNAAIIAVMSDALLRSGEVVDIQVGDIERRQDGAATLTVQRSKTDPEGDGASLYLGPPTIGRVNAWIEAAVSSGADMSNGPLFRRIRRGQHVSAEPLSTRSIQAIVRSAAAAVGIDGASSHSLRIGSAVSLARAGATLIEAQQAGRWASPLMPAHYARNETAARGAVARLRYQKT